MPHTHIISYQYYEHMMSHDLVNHGNNAISLILFYCLQIICFVMQLLYNWDIHFLKSFAIFIYGLKPWNYRAIKHCLLTNV